MKRSVYFAGLNGDDEREKEALREQEVAQRLISVLQQRGPMSYDDARNRVCCASEKRFRNAVRTLQRDGLLNTRGVDEGSVMRLAGHARLPEPARARKTRGPKAMLTIGGTVPA